MAETMKFNAAFVQFDVKVGNVAVNLAVVGHQLEDLAEAGVRLVVLPEMWSCGFDNEHLHLHAAETPRLLEAVSGFARQYGMVVAGSLPEEVGGDICNTLYLVDADGTVMERYRKIHLFTLTGEEKYFIRGASCVVAETRLGRIGLSICYDLRFPELYRTLTLRGAEIVLISAQWPRSRIGRWDILTRARAIENQTFVIAVNRCGRSGETAFGGHSVIVDPAGEVLQMADFEPCSKIAEIDLSRVGAVRSHMPCLKERVPGAYEY